MFLFHFRKNFYHLVVVLGGEIDLCVVVLLEGGELLSCVVVSRLDGDELS